MPESRGKYTLDELLRAKRKERPEPEFWTSFERELKSKQRLLIQKQLVSESRLKSPSAARFYKFGAFTATCGLAAFAVVVGLRTTENQDGLISQQGPSEIAAPSTPTFNVATKQSEFTPATQAGLQEFATLAQTSRPRVIVQQSQPATKAPTPSQLSAIETIAQLEKKIRANRSASSSGTSNYQFVSSSGLFELNSEANPAEETVAESLSSFEQAYLLGKYADPLNRKLDPAQSPFQGRNRVDTVSFSQLDDALSSQGAGTRHDKSLDALTVRF